MELKRKGEHALEAGPSLGRAGDRDLCELITSVFDRLRSRGTTETHALHAALRVFSYHEPGIRRDLATAIVEGLAVHRDIVA